MIIEYLLFDKTIKDKIRKFNYAEEIRNKINTSKTITPQISFTDYSDDNMFAVKIELSGGTKENAKYLSIIHSYIKNNYESFTLTNESSQYYCQKLYPLINSFEMKFRKFLYLKSTTCTSDKTKDFIKAIEEKTFEQIYEALFVDDNFVKKTLHVVNDEKGNNQRSKSFTRDEIIARISKIEEKNEWDKLVGDDVLLTIRNNFLTIKEFRNDVMHAHNISTENYKKIKELYSTINSQLDEEIQKLIDYPGIISTQESAIDSIIDKLIPYQNLDLSLYKPLVIPEIDQIIENSSYMSAAVKAASENIMNLIHETYSANMLSAAQEAIQAASKAMIESIRENLPNIDSQIEETDDKKKNDNYDEQMNKKDENNE